MSISSKSVLHQVVEVILRSFLTISKIVIPAEPAPGLNGGIAGIKAPEMELNLSSNGIG